MFLVQWKYFQDNMNPKFWYNFTQYVLEMHLFV